MPTIKKIIIFCGTLAVLLSGFDFVSGKIILQTSENPAALNQQQVYLNKLKITGLILSSLTLRWNDAPDQLIAQRKNLRALKQNVPQLYLQIDLAEDLPKWDSADWAIVEDNIQEIAREARRSGITGIILNTDSGQLASRNYYSNNQLWKPEYNKRYADISDAFAEQILYQRGRELRQVIEAVSPRARIAVTPAGPAEPATANYAYWHHFVNGLFSAGQNNTLFASVRANPEQTTALAAQSLSGLLETRIQAGIIPVYRPQSQPDEKILQALQDNNSVYVLQAKFADLLQFLAGNVII
ncbi:MAG: hypothetical protein LBD99_01760 [Candidatus Margulisbacteria bacterium]|jgi:hypothetical protein|nr:hypothetical protein [Candidatus Margulisiibacteriota bacterium]